VHVKQANNEMSPGPGGCTTFDVLSAVAPI